MYLISIFLNFIYEILYITAVIIHKVQVAKLYKMCEISLDLFCHYQTKKYSNIIKIIVTCAHKKPIDFYLSVCIFLRMQTETYVNF
jgi:hypothetical protein